MPPSIPIIRLERLATLSRGVGLEPGTSTASSAMASRDAAKRRFRTSLFGQLYAKIGSWTSEYRRNYVFREDKGQGRSFKVEFHGETAQDNGGPCVGWVVRRRCSALGAQRVLMLCAGTELCWKPRLPQNPARRLACSSHAPTVWMPVAASTVTSASSLLLQSYPLPPLPLALTHSFTLPL